MKWEWCTIEKPKGGLGLKYLRLQGIALAVKWVIGALEGGEPWKFFIRINMLNVIPKHAKSWRSLSLNDILSSEETMLPGGSNVFRTIWKA